MVSLGEANRAIVKKSPPWAKKLFYIAKESWPKGSIPPHLVGNTREFASAASACAPAVRGMPKGPDKVKVFNGCVGDKLRK